MKLRILLLSLSLALFAGLNASAQLAPAEDFFDSGAQLYISNNIPAALERVEMGLKTYPDDGKLKKLEQLLKQQQQQQNQQQNQKNQQSKSDQQKNQQDQKNQQNQQNQSQQQKDQKEQQKQEDQKQKAAAQKKDEQQKDQDQQKSEAEKQKDGQQQKPEPTGQAQPAKPGEMTPEEARQLLDAQKGNEQLLPMKPDGKPRDPTKPVKDW